MSFIIKGKFSKHVSLRCQDSDDAIPFDVAFKIFSNETESVSKDEIDVNAREIMAHKFILASFSPVFKKMFYGALKESKDVIPVKQSTADAFSLLIDYFYQVDINCEELTILELFDLANLAERYDVPELMNELTRQMEIVPVTMKNIMEVAITASKFSHFEAASSALLLNCAKVFKENVFKDKDQIEFTVAQEEKGNGSVAVKLLTLVRSLPPILECNNCHEKECLKGSLVTWDKLEEGLKVQAITSATNKHCTAFNVNSKDAEKAAAATAAETAASILTFQLKYEDGQVTGYRSLKSSGGRGILLYDC